MKPLLVIDIGNSATKWAWWDSKGFDHRGRAATYDGTEIENGLVGRVAPGDAAVIVSVVPARCAEVGRELLSRTGVPPLVVSANVRLPFRMTYKTPETLGADRIAAVAGALALADGHGRADRPVIVVDAGTAVTIEVVDRARGYVGGTIGPGPGLMRDALKMGTAQLPGVQLDPPVSAVGTSTDEALRSGIMHGFASMVEGLVRRIADELTPAEPFVVGTGGWAPFLQDATGVFDVVDADLVLRGAVVIAACNP